MTVELDEADVPSLQPGMPPHAKHQTMMIEADSMVVRYLLESEQISNEYATARMAEINSRRTRVPVR